MSSIGHHSKHQYIKFTARTAVPCKQCRDSMMRILVSPSLTLGQPLEVFADVAGALNRFDQPLRFPTIGGPGTTSGVVELTVATYGRLFMTVIQSCSTRSSGFSYHQSCIARAQAELMDVCSNQALKWSGMVSQRSRGFEALEYVAICSKRASVVVWQ